MIRGTRFITGLITFVVMAFFLAEGVFASACTPGMAMIAASTAPADGPSHDPDCRPGLAERDGHDLPDCPFGSPGSVQGCAPAASLPATSAVEIAPSPDGADLVIATDTEPDLLLGSALFHPPKS